LVAGGDPPFHGTATGVGFPAFGSGSRALRATLLTIAVAATACSEPVEFPDWTFRVPEGTRVVEYDGVPLEKRDQWIDLVEELTIGGPDGDEGLLLHPRGYTEGGLAVDARDGRLFVLDNGNFRVLAFDAASGAHLFRVGQQGEGPGELRRPTRIAIAGDQLVIVDSTAPKLSYWSLDGEHVRDVSAQAVRLAQYIAGFSDSSLVVRIPERDGDDRKLVLARIDAEGEELHRYSSSPGPRFDNAMISGRTLMVSHLGPEATFAVADGDRLYWTPANEYQVAAAGAGGAFEWALRVALPAAPYPQAQIDGMLESIRGRFPEATEATFNWPETYPVLSRLLVDGHGHLYVFPYVDSDYLEAHGGRPVDVYGPGGERLFTGMIASTWEAALDDAVFNYEELGETEEWGVVRYRLAEPFR
jgi:hypothetical protein